MQNPQPPKKSSHSSSSSSGASASSSSSSSSDSFQLLFLNNELSTILFDSFFDHLISQSKQLQAINNQLSFVLAIEIYQPGRLLAEENAWLRQKYETLREKSQAIWWDKMVKNPLFDITRRNNNQSFRTMASWLNTDVAAKVAYLNQALSGSLTHQTPSNTSSKIQAWINFFEQSIKNTTEDTSDDSMFGSGGDKPLMEDIRSINRLVSEFLDSLALHRSGHGGVEISTQEVCEKIMKNLSNIKHAFEASVAGNTYQEINTFKLIALGGSLPEISKISGLHTPKNIIPYLFNIRFKLLSIEKTFQDLTNAADNNAQSSNEDDEKESLDLAMSEKSLDLISALIQEADPLGSTKPTASSSSASSSSASSSSASSSSASSSSAPSSSGRQASSTAQRLSQSGVLSTTAPSTASSSSSSASSSSSSNTSSSGSQTQTSESTSTDSTSSSPSPY